MGQILTLLKAVLEEEEIYAPTPDLFVLVSTSTNSQRDAWEKPGAQVKVELIWVGFDWLCHPRMGECKNCRRKVGWERVIGGGFYVCAGVCGLMHWVCWRWGTRKREVILISLSHWGSGGGGRGVLVQQGFINWGGPCENLAWAELGGESNKNCCAKLSRRSPQALCNAHLFHYDTCLTKFVRIERANLLSDWKSNFK